MTHWYNLSYTVLLLVLVSIAVPASAVVDEVRQVDLSGEWAFAIDREDVGIDQQWFAKDLPDIIKLPGSMRDQGFGDEVGPDTDWWGGDPDFSRPMYEKYNTKENFKSPAWLTPTLRYTGAAWYQKVVEIPADWKGKHVTVHFERPHIHSQLWVNDQRVGKANSVSVPHTFDVTDAIRPGEANRITLLVDSRMDPNIGESSHSVTDHTQTPWNGVVGEMKLIARPPVWIDDAQIHAKAGEKSVRIEAELGNKTGDDADRAVTIQILDADKNVVATRQADLQIDEAGYDDTWTVEIDQPLSTWDEFDPVLYTMKITLGEEGNADVWTDRFGVRTLETDGSIFVLNGRTMQFRGTLDCAIFPKTGYPPTDVKSWRNIIKTQQAHGLNHTRFHSWCPPEAAFIAADELGHYFQVECGTWCNGGSASVGEGHAIDQWLMEEGERVIKEYGNHPSFLLLCAGNEPGGPERGAVYLRKWVEHFKKQDDRFLVTSGGGWPLIEESEFHCAYGPRLQGWGAGLNGILNSTQPATTEDFSAWVANHPNIPAISHETGQWCAWPNFGEMDKYTGSLKPKNFEMFQDFLEQRHLTDQYDDFLAASGKYQVMAYKEEVERSLRTPGLGGFQLLGLQDFSGQGTAIVGVVDAFWEAKPYMDAEEFRRFCNDTVVLARVPSRTFEAGDAIPVAFELSHYGPRDLENATLQWQLVDTAGKVLLDNEVKLARVPTGKLTRFVDTTLATPAGVAQKLTIKASLVGTDIANDWDVWVYPKDLDTDAPEGVNIARTLEEAGPMLDAGERVVLLADPITVDSNVEIGFSPIFWNTSYTSMQAPHTMGVLVDPSHPALSQFPTDFHGNWQWWDPMMSSATMEMDHLPPAMKPIVQVVPDWFDPKRLALVAEAKVGKGRLLLCSVDLETDLDNRLTARALRASLMSYAASKAFDPEFEVKLSDLEPMFKTPAALASLRATVEASDFHPQHPAENVLDDNPSTIWHTTWSPTAPFPHDLTIDLKTDVELRGVVAQPRQDSNPNGRIADYEIYVSNNGKVWGEPVAKGSWSGDNSAKEVNFDTPVTARFVRLRSLREINNAGYTSLAGFDVLLQESE